MVKSKSLLSVYFVAHLINHLSTVSIRSLYSTLKVVTKPLDINQNKLIFYYLKTRRCKYYTLNIVYIMKQHKLPWIRNLRNEQRFDLKKP